MHEKYHYKSDWLHIAGYSMIIGSFFIWLIGIGAERSNQEELAGGLFIGWFIVMCIIVCLLSYMPASFHAEDDSVTFCLLFRKIYIPYNSISSIEVTRHYARAQIRGEIPHYVEDLHIVCNDVEYNFHAPMQINMEEVAVHPEKLQKQFENGIFQRLQLYIESRR